MPLVTIGHKIEGTDFDLVCSDNRLAASMLTEHLLRLGHLQDLHTCGQQQSVSKGFSTQ